MQETIEILVFNKSPEERARIKSLFNLLLANLSISELSKIDQALKKNPKLLKAALKFI